MRSSQLRGRGFYGFILAGGLTMHGGLEELPRQGDLIEPVQHSNVNYSLTLFPVAFSDVQSAEVRLYRPGFRTVVKDSQEWWRCWTWLQTHEIQWQEAAGIVNKEKAVDDLVEGGFYRLCIPQAERSFIASEYRRLAASPELDVPEGAAIRLRLLRKASDAQRDEAE